MGYIRTMPSSQKPRVAFVNDWYAPEIVGGVENSVSEVVHEFVRVGHQVRVFTPNQSFLRGRHKIEGVSVHYTFGLYLRRKYRVTALVHILEKIRVLFDLVTPFYTLLCIKRYKPSFVIFHEIDRFGNLLLLFARLFFKKRQLIRVHHDLSDTCFFRSRTRFGMVCIKPCASCLPKSRMNSYLSRLVKINVSNSKFVAEELQSLGYQTDVLNVGNPCRIRSPQLIMLPRRDPLFSIGFVGRITKLKGIETIFHASAILNPKWQVHCIGPITQKYQGHLVALASQLEIEVFFYAPQSNPFKVVEKLVDCIVVGSESLEAFGKVPIEASLAGIPVISTEIGGLAESLDYISPRPAVFVPKDSASLSILLKNFERPDYLRVEPSNQKTLSAVILEKCGE
jgi:glycosyltransferase involved in cell wall biosynthesis